jgi:hypothetical protein
MYKLASKAKLSETAISSSAKDDNRLLACHLCPIYHFLDIQFSDADLYLIGEHQRDFVELGDQVCCFSLMV